MDEFELEIITELSRLGGRVDYFTLREIRDQLTKIVAKINKKLDE